MKQQIKIIHCLHTFCPSHYPSYFTEEVWLGYKRYQPQSQTKHHNHVYVVHHGLEMRFDGRFQLG